MWGDVWLFVTQRICDCKGWQHVMGVRLACEFGLYLGLRRCIFQEEEHHSIIVLNQFCYLHIISILKIPLFYYSY